MGGGPQQLACLHTSASLESKSWERKNKTVYPPQLPDEPPRRAVSSCLFDYGVQSDRMCWSENTCRKLSWWTWFKSFLWSVILPFSKAQCYVCTQYMFEENDRSFPYPFNKVFCWQTLSHFVVSFLQEVHHCRRQIKYSKDKMWYLAKMVRPFSSVSVSHISPIKWGFFPVGRLRLWIVSNRRPQKGLWCICVFPFSFSAFLLFSWLHLIHVVQLCRGTLTLFALLHRSEGWASTRLSHSWSSTTRRGRRSWKRFEAARSPQSQKNVLSNSCIIMIFLFSLLLVLFIYSACSGSSGSPGDGSQESQCRVQIQFIYR